MLTTIKNMMFMGVLLFFCSPIISMRIEDQDPDEIVNQIKRYSNFTKQDQYPRFLFLDNMGRPVAGLLSLYAAAKIGSLTRSMAKPVNAVLKNEMQPSFLRLSHQSIDTWVNEGLWGGLGGLGAGYKILDFLDSGTKIRVLKKVDDLEALCKKLFVTQRYFINPDKLRFDCMQAGGLNDMWSSLNPLVVYNGILFLLQQCRYASGFLANIGRAANDTILLATNCLVHNIRHYEYAAQNANLMLRHEKSAQQGQEYFGAELFNKKLQNVTGVWNLIKDISKTAYKYKEPIAAAGLSVWGYRSLFGPASSSTEVKKE